MLMVAFLFLLCLAELLDLQPNVCVRHHVQGCKQCSQAESVMSFIRLIREVCCATVCVWEWITLLMHGCTLLNMGVLYTEDKYCVGFSRDAQRLCVCVRTRACKCVCIPTHTAILYLCIIFCDILKATEGEEMELPGMEICERFRWSW